MILFIIKKKTLWWSSVCIFILAVYGYYLINTFSFCSSLSPFFWGGGARILEWVAIPFSRRSSRPRDWTWVSRIVGRPFTVWATREVMNSHHELLIAKFRLKLKKVGKTTRPFRYDLNQIPYDSTVEVKNRFKGLDQIDECLMNYGRRFVTLYRRQGSRPSPWKRNAKKQNGCLRRAYK